MNRILPFFIAISVIAAQIDFNEGPYGSEYFDIAGPFTLIDLNMELGDVNSDNVKTSSKVDKTTTQDIKSQADAVAGSKYSDMFSGPNEGESTFSGIPPTIAVKTAPVDKSVPLTTNYQSSLLNDNDRKILKLYVFIIPSALILILIGVIALQHKIKKNFA